MGVGEHPPPSFPFFQRSLFRHLNIDFADFLDGKQTLSHQELGNHRFELVEENVDAVDLVARIAGDHAAAERVGEFVVDLAENSDMFADNLNPAGTLNFSFRADG